MGAWCAQVWTPQEIMALQIEKITDTPSFCFLWSGSGVSLQWGRACLRKWGYRWCEDISWIKSNRTTGKNINFLPDSVVTPTTEHCLVGIKVRALLTRDWYRKTGTSAGTGVSHTLLRAVPLTSGSPPGRCNWCGQQLVLAGACLPPRLGVC